MVGLRRMQTQKLIQIDNNVQSTVSPALIFLGDFDSFFNTGEKKRLLRNVHCLSTICSILKININVDVKYILIFTNSFIILHIFKLDHLNIQL